MCEQLQSFRNTTVATESRKREQSSLEIAVRVLREQPSFLSMIRSTFYTFPRVVSTADRSVFGSSTSRRVSSSSRMGFYSPEPLTSKSERPVSDGTTRLWTSTTCPFAQRVWIAIKYKGLNDAIQLVAINLSDRPAWYKEVYPVNKVPALEHNNKIIGESLDLLTYLDEHFDGPKLLPKDEDKQQVTKDILKHTDSLVGSGFKALRGLDYSTADAEALIKPDLDFLEATLEKYSSEGSFFLGEFGTADAAVAPFFERFVPLFDDIFSYDVFAGRPHLKKWFEKLNTFAPYTETTNKDPKYYVSAMKPFLGRPQNSVKAN